MSCKISCDPILPVFFRMIDPLPFAANLARETGELLLRYYQSPQTHSTLKPDHTILTEADLAADEHLTNTLQTHFPADHILSEEGNTVYAGHTTWVIDPLDGTSNFALGIHYWGVSIARIVDGWPDTAALYFPVIGELYTAQRGKGATLNGHPIHTSNAPHPRPVAFFTCDSRVFRRYHVEIPYKARILGSAAYNFCALARGVSTVGFETTPRLWDIAASWLVLREAGGAIQPYAQEPFPLQPGTDYKPIPFPLLGAENAETLTYARQRITRKE
ncbi:MAG: inositol phosphatase [Anaerolineales bacterium]|nr:inositol phosphatase [Anaerolineales bacterium]